MEEYGLKKYLHSSHHFLKTSKEGKHLLAGDVKGMLALGWEKDCLLVQLFAKALCGCGMETTLLSGSWKSSERSFTVPAKSAESTGAKPNLAYRLVSCRPGPYALVEEYFPVVSSLSKKEHELRLMCKHKTTRGRS